MIAIESFPAQVVEVLAFIRQGPILRTTYQSSDNASIVTTDIENVLSEYLNQDISPPHFPLVEITQDASSEIPYPNDESGRSMRRSLIDFAEQENFYQQTLEKVTNLTGFSNDQIELITDAIGNDLFLCAQSRLLSQQPHLHFEKIFSIYKRQGFPYGWIGEGNWSSGNFLIYSHAYT